MQERWVTVLPFQMRDALNHLTYRRQSEVVVVCGPSGSGKSTLIKYVNALEPFQKGDITVEGISVTDPKTNFSKLRARIGMVSRISSCSPT